MHLYTQEFGLVEIPAANGRFTLPSGKYVDVYPRDGACSLYVFYQPQSGRMFLMDLRTPLAQMEEEDFANGVYGLYPLVWEVTPNGLLSKGEAKTLAKFKEWIALDKCPFCSTVAVLRETVCIGCGAS